MRRLIPVAACRRDSSSAAPSSRSSSAAASRRAPPRRARAPPVSGRAGRAAAADAAAWRRRSKPNGECPPGTTESRPGSCRAPEFPAAEHRRLPAAARRSSRPSTWCRRRSSRPSTSTATRRRTRRRREPRRPHQGAGLDQRAALVIIAPTTCPAQRSSRRSTSSATARTRIASAMFDRHSTSNGVGPGWAEKAVAQLEADVKAGAVGVGEDRQGLRPDDAEGGRHRASRSTTPSSIRSGRPCARLNIPVFIHTAEPQEFFQPLDMHNERWLELSLFADRRNYGPGKSDVRAADDRARQPVHGDIRRRRSSRRTSAGTPTTSARAGEACSTRMPNVVLEVGAVLYDFGRQPRAAREFFVKYQDRILFGKDAVRAERVPVLLARVRDERRVLRLLPRLSRVLEALRHGLAGRGAEEALLPERAADDAGSAADRLAHDSAHQHRAWPRYVVTGGAGFIGSHLVEELLRRGESVRIADNFSTGRRENLPADGQVRAGRRRRRRSGRRAHAPSPAASSSSTRRRFRRCRGRSPDPVTLASRERRRRRSRCSSPRATPGSSGVVFAGSSSVYGDTRGAAQARGHAAEPALAVRAAEAHRRAVLPDVHAALRARDGDDAVLQRVRAAPAAGVAVLGRDLALHRGARQRQGAARSTATASRRATSRTSRDVVHRRAARVRGAERGRRSHQRRRRRPDLAARTRAHAADHPQELGRADVRPDREGDVRDSQADILKARKLLGFEPVVPFDEGLRRTVAWYQSTAATSASRG